MNTVVAGMRYPLSLVCGLALTGSLFWVLWLFTSETFEYTVIPAVEIEFTRLERDETTQTREREPRVEREEPVFVDPPRIITGGGGGVDNVVTLATTPVVAIGGVGGIAMGRDSDIVPLVRVQPVYPPREAARGIEGWVLLQFDITASGAVANVIVVESEPGTAFDKAAADAVARWRYNPRVVNGQAVERVGVRTRISFDLEDE